MIGLFWYKVIKYYAEGLIMPRGKGVMLKEEIPKWGFFKVEAKVGMGVQRGCQEVEKGGGT